MSSIINFVRANWVLLLVLFGLGGTATVVGVVPGLDGVHQFVEGQVDATKAKLVSETTTQE